MNIKWHDEKKSTLNVHEKNGVVWLSFPNLDREDWLNAVFSTRIGGVSRGPLASMNFSFTQELLMNAESGPYAPETLPTRNECRAITNGCIIENASLSDADVRHALTDEDAWKNSSFANVLENFRLFADAAGFRAEDIVCSDQTHTTNVLRVGRSDSGSGITRPLDWLDVDGFITDEPGVVLSTFYADCVPLYFADPVHHAIGLSHSGWKGTSMQMGRVTVEAMKREFGSDPRDMLAAIGPSISGAHYEVSWDVARHFDPEFRPLEYPDRGLPAEEEKYMLDLWGVNRKILMDAGIPEENIQLPNLCTFENADIMFSHRASHGKRGNLGAFISIR